MEKNFKKAHAYVIKVIKGNPKLVYSLSFLSLLWIIGSYYFFLLNSPNTVMLTQLVSEKILDADANEQVRYVSDLAGGKEIGMSNMFGIYKLTAALNQVERSFSTMDFPYSSTDYFNLIVASDTSFFIVDDKLTIKGPYKIEYKLVKEQTQLSGHRKYFRARDKASNQCLVSIDASGVVTPYYLDRSIDYDELVHMDPTKHYVLYAARSEFGDKVRSLLKSFIFLTPVDKFPDPTELFTCRDSSGIVVSVSAMRGTYIVEKRYDSLIVHRILEMRDNITITEKYRFKPVNSWDETVQGKEVFMIVDNRIFFDPLNSGFSELKVTIPQDSRIIDVLPNHNVVVAGPREVSIIDPKTESTIVTVKTKNGYPFTVGNEVYLFENPRSFKGATRKLSKIKGNELVEVVLPDLHTFKNIAFLRHSSKVAYMANEVPHLPSFLFSTSDTVNHESVDAKIINVAIAPDSLSIDILPNRFVILVVFAFALCVFILGFNIVGEPPVDARLQSTIYDKIPSLKDKLTSIEKTLGALKIRYDTMLYLGITIGIFGVGGFLIIVENLSKATLTHNGQVDWLNLVRPITLLLFIETLSFFFLRQHRIIFKEYKVFYSAYLRVINYYNVMEIHHALGVKMNVETFSNKILEEPYNLSTETNDEPGTLVYQDIIKRIIDNQLK